MFVCHNGEVFEQACADPPPAPCECQCRAGCAETLTEEGKLVYVAGPISAPDPIAMLENIRAGIAAARWILAAGHYPFCPHLDHQLILTRGVDEPVITVDALQANSMAWLRKADIVVVLPGWEDSKGCRAEINEASLQGISVQTFAEFRLWCESAEFRLWCEYGDEGVR
jgi:hypothetical protein